MHLALTLQILEVSRKRTSLRTILNDVARDKWFAIRCRVNRLRYKCDLRHYISWGSDCLVTCRNLRFFVAILCKDILSTPVMINARTGYCHP